MESRDRYDSLIRYYAEQYGLPWKLVKKQMLAESSADPKVVSPVGAQGLMQFMSASWHEWGRGDPENPEESIKAGCAYMAHLFSCYGEIPDERERYKFALAAYNAGRGNVNRMLEFAREATGASKRYSDWVAAGRPSGPWQRWEFASRFLSLVTGEHAKETLGYVRKIMGEA